MQSPHFPELLAAAARLGWVLLAICTFVLATLWCRGDLPALPADAVQQAQQARICAKIRAAVGPGVALPARCP